MNLTNLVSCTWVFVETGEDSPLIVQLLLGLAATYLEDGQEDKGIETYKRVVAILERISGPDDEQLALPLAEMGHALLEAGRFDEAEIATIRCVAGYFGDLFLSNPDVLKYTQIGIFVPFKNSWQVAPEFKKNNIECGSLTVKTSVRRHETLLSYA